MGHDLVYYEVYSDINEAILREKANENMEKRSEITLKHESRLKIYTLDIIR